MLSRLPAFILLCLAALTGSRVIAEVPGLVGADIVAPRSDEDLLVLQVRLGSRVLSHGLLAYPAPLGILLPLGELMDLLDFPIAVHPQSGTAQGWFLAEDRKFHLNLARGEVVADGQPSRLDGQSAEAHPDEIYVASNVLSRWFPVDFEIDLAEMTLQIVASQKLPLELRAAREERWQILRETAQGVDERQFMPREAPFERIGWPRFDANVQASLESPQDGAFRTTLRHAVLARADVLGMSADLFLAGNSIGEASDPLNDLRLILSRNDPHGRLLGLLKATELSLGDLSSPNDPLISRGRSGRGVQISNVPRVRQRTFDHITLRGDALPGWDLELYLDGILYDVRNIGSDGRYEFTDVPLRFGPNELRWVFYGPHGEQREKVERFFIGADLLPPGETHYRLGLYQQDVGFLQSHDGLSPRDESLRGALRVKADVEHGWSRRFSVFAGLSSLELEDGRHDYGRLGLRTSLLGGAGRLQLARNARGGWAGDVAWQRSLGHFNLFLEHREFSQFVSDEIRSRELESQSRVRLDVQLRIPGLGSVPVGLTLRRQRQSGDDEQQLRMTHRMQRRIGPLQLAHRWNLDFDGSRLDLDGTLQVHGRLPQFTWRGHLTYRLQPQIHISSLDASGHWQLREKLNTRFGLRHGLAQNVTSATGGLDWELAPVRLGLDLSVSSDGSFRAGAGISFSLGRDPRSSRWNLRSGAQARQSAVSARVFLDRNADGTFDDGDTPLPGVAFRTNGSRLALRTDANGIARVPLASYRPVDLTLDEDSLEDPFWVPEIAGQGFLSRPGVVWAADFPVVSTGEIDGTVYLQQGKTRRELAKVTLELVNNKGEVVQQVISQFDGFYLLERVRPGTYTLRVASDPLARLGLDAPTAKEIILRSGEVRSGVDFTLTRK